MDEGARKLGEKCLGEVEEGDLGDVSSELEMWVWTMTNREIGA